MTQLNPTQTAQALTLGKLVNVAYAMYKSGGDPLPTPPSPIMTGFEFVAWVQMKDFILSSTDYSFYGFIARDTSKVNGYVLAIRGTQDLEEWWDDLTSMVLVPMTNFGQVGYGFNRIYQTMRVIYPLTPLVAGAAAARAAPASLESAGTFAAQVSAAVQRDVAAQAAASSAAVAPAPIPLMSITVAGHSLGSALATLYVADNSLLKQAQVPLICTFASPRVGDPTFATTFGGLGIESWRVVNELDLVPNLPYFGFQHIAVEYDYNSGAETVWSLACWHSLDTYLHLLDTSQPLLPSCVWPPLQPAVAAAVLSSRPAATTPLRESMRAALAAAAPAAVAASAPAENDMTLTVPAGTTINITIKVG
jgi:triacylglycerol lipase